MKFSIIISILAIALGVAADAPCDPSNCNCCYTSAQACMNYGATNGETREPCFHFTNVKEARGYMCPDEVKKDCKADCCSLGKTVWGNVPTPRHYGISCDKHIRRSVTSPGGKCIKSLAVSNKQELGGGKGQSLKTNNSKNKANGKNGLNNLKSSAEKGSGQKGTSSGATKKTSNNTGGKKGKSPH